jgi:hypothetical protein
MRDALRRAIERFVPWYDRDTEARRAAHTEAIRQRSIAARMTVEHLTPAAQARIRKAYAAYGRELRRR